MEHGLLQLHPLPQLPLVEHLHLHRVPVLVLPEDRDHLRCNLQDFFSFFQFYLKVKFVAHLVVGEPALLRRPLLDLPVQPDVLPELLRQLGVAREGAQGGVEVDAPPGCRCRCRYRCRCST